MADPRFRSKEGPFGRSLSLSLGFRVLFLSLALVVVPLIVFTWLSDIQMAEIKQEEAFLELGLIAEDQKRAVEEKLEFMQRDLHLAASFVQMSSDPNYLNTIFQQIVSIFPQQVLLLLHNTPGTGWTVIASSEPALLQRKPPCEEMQNTDLKGIQTCVWNDREMLFFTESLGADTQVGFLLPLQDIIYLSEHESKESSRIHLMDQGKVIEESGWSLENTEIIPYVDVLKAAFGMESPNIPHKTERIATKISILGTTFEILIDVPVRIHMVHQHLWYLVSWIVGLLIVVGGGLVYWLTLRMARPMNQLAMAMEKVENGQEDVQYTKDRLGFEINDLGMCFNHMLKTMKENIREREKQTVEKELLSKELTLGHAIQKRLFPRSLPHLPHLDIATAFHPANRVAGDFYDLFAAEGKLLIVMADAAGKGVSACLYALSLRGMLRSLAESGKALEEMIPIAQKLLESDAGESGMFITAWIGLLDTSSLELHYATLGHFPAILRRQSKLQELTTSGSALGVEGHKPLTFAKVTLQSNDLLFLYTDGLIEAFENNRQAMMEKLSLIQEKLPAEDVLQAITPPPPYIDDLTLVAIRII